jgi:hypothetical protein
MQQACGAEEEKGRGQCWLLEEPQRLAQAADNDDSQLGQDKPN